jgi:hypothetical protein
MDSWDYARYFTISDEEANSGSSGVKSFKLTKQCDGGKHFVKEIGPFLDHLFL